MNSANTIDAVLIDVAGVIHNSGVPIRGSVEAINSLREAKIPFRLVTNTTSKSVAQIRSTLALMNVSVRQDELITATQATVAFLKANSLRPYLLVSDEIRAEFESVESCDPNCVVIGDAGNDLCFQSLNEAFRVLDVIDDSQLIAMGGNKFYRAIDGKLSLDILPFAEMLSYATGKAIIVTGKPNAAFFDAAVKTVCEPESRSRCYMVGDDLESDVGGALDYGMNGVLVRTGKFKEAQLKNSSVQPTAIFDDLWDFVRSIVNVV